MNAGGTVYGVGVGPGDPELMTLKAARLIAAAPVVAFFARAGGPGLARTIADGVIAADAEQLRLEYPYTVELPSNSAAYVEAMRGFYDRAAAAIAERAAAGLDVAVLCEGDPFLYGSFMHLFDRLAGRTPCEEVPGITGMSGCWSRAGLPMTEAREVLSVLPATLPAERLEALLATADAAVFMKLGRHLAKLRGVLERTGRLERAVYVERGTMPGERIVRLADLPEATAAPYFSMVLLPARAGTP